MIPAKYVFVGNRRFVLQAMLRNKLPISTIFVIKNTHLERDCKSGLFGDTPYIFVSCKKELLDYLGRAEFDVLISNGCPYILPLEKLPSAKYVNIHPSPLPDLRGVDPVIGSILLGRDAGATCHVMDAGIDTGNIIAQVRIPYSSDLDVTTLYQLSFIAEKIVFDQALQLDFQPQQSQEDVPSAIYYSRSAADMHISATDSNEEILRKIKAFNNRSIGCRFTADGNCYKVYAAMRMENSFLADHVRSFGPCTVALSYEDSIVFHKDGEILRFMGVVPLESPLITTHQKLFGI